MMALGFLPEAQALFFFRTAQGCSVLCLQNFDTCSAFSFENDICTLGDGNGPIKLPDTPSQVPVTQVWRDAEAIPG